MIAGLLRRLRTALPGGDVLSRSGGDDPISAGPGLRDELADRARAAGLLVAVVAAVAVPAWTVVDRIAVPHLAATFFVVRLVCDVPMLWAIWALWKLPVGRRRPEVLTFAVLALVQLEIAWMIPQTGGHEHYLLGFTLALYGSGCILVTRPRWTVGVVAVSWLALGGSVIAQPGRLAAGDLLMISVYLCTASVIGMLAHRRRYALTSRELVTRIRLEREQQRTAVLLAQLERLSNEDPLTGLANRRRWDTALAGACREARERNSVVGVVLLDIDHFKRINDRYGHPGGDETLKAVAGLLSGRVRAGELAARLGGDELAVLLPGADLDQACELAERLRSEAAELLPAGVDPGELSLSLGVAAAAGSQADPGDLMSRADEQLYRAKITRNAVGAARRDPAVPQPRQVPLG